MLIGKPRKQHKTETKPDTWKRRSDLKNYTPLGNSVEHCSHSDFKKKKIFFFLPKKLPFMFFEHEQ